MTECPSIFVNMKTGKLYSRGTVSFFTNIHDYSMEKPLAPLSSLAGPDPPRRSHSLKSGCHAEVKRLAIVRTHSWVE